MDEKQIANVVSYWLKTAEETYETMNRLFEGRRYADCLFFGHLLLERILKAWVVNETKDQAPFIHDLVRLQELARLNLPEKEIDFLNKVNDFNIRARYPDYKLKFYKLCTKQYTEDHLNKIKDIYKTLCQRLKQKK